MSESKRPYPSGRRLTRPGSIYIVVLGAAMVVSLLGLSALMIQRIQRRANQQSSDVATARLNAQAALRIGLLRIQNDPDWRHSFPSGVWEADVPLGGGSYTLEGIDPSDNDLSDDAEDPLTLIGTGKKGTCLQKSQITLAPQYRGYGCLEVALHAGNDVKIDGATVDCDQILSANHNVDASSSQVNCDVEAVGSISGSTYNGTTTEGVETRDLPDKTEVFQHYLDHGTRIDKDSLPLGFSNVLRNPGFESGTGSWSPWESPPGTPTCKITTVTEAYSGAAALAVQERSSFEAGPAQDVAGIIQSGVTYDCQAWIYMDARDAEVHLVIDVDSSGEGAQSWESSNTKCPKYEWVLVSKTLTPTFTGTVKSAGLRIETKKGDPVESFLVDDAVFKESGSERTIYQKVLSPTSNPFGSQTNPQGIYVIDLADKKIFIKNTRIVGTLVLLTPNGGSHVGSGGPLSWEPAVPNLPALLVSNKDVTIDPGNVGLNEIANQTNFNPPGTPYDELGEDSDQDDTYPSEIQGLIYATNKIKLRNQPVLIGAVVAHDTVEIRDRLDLTHSPNYLRNPPPGFSGPEEIKIVLDSAMKIAD